LILACIDIGSNTTRLLVADAGDGWLRELSSERVFTRIGRSLAKDEAIPAAKIDETAEVVARQARVARDAGAEQVVGVATAAIRGADNREELCAVVERAAGISISILADEDEARLAFLGATRTLSGVTGGAVAVIDVGGGSTELAVGDPRGQVAWSSSFRIGSGLLADSYLNSDPPAADAIDAARGHVEATFEGLAPPRAHSALAVGGTATSLRRLVGGELSHDSLARGIRFLAATPIAEVARRFELDPERVRLLPAGILILEALSRRLSLPLSIARGGLREGVLLELVEGRGPATA
jgi:exopolyphosphatase/guanosine-5'-triphosphate,3'-diphosphate pyrophosphatase